MKKLLALFLSINLLSMNLTKASDQEDYIPAQPTQIFPHTQTLNHCEILEGDYATPDKRSPKVRSVKKMRLSSLLKTTGLAWLSITGSIRPVMGWPFSSIHPCSDYLSSTPTLSPLTSSQYNDLALQFKSSNPILSNECWEAAYKRSEWDKQIEQEDGKNAARELVKIKEAFFSNNDQNKDVKQITEYLCLGGDFFGALLHNPALIFAAKGCHLAHGAYYAVEDLYAGFGEDGFDYNKPYYGFDLAKIDIASLTKDASEALWSYYSLHLDWQEYQLNKENIKLQSSVNKNDREWINKNENLKKIKDNLIEKRKKDVFDLFKMKVEKTSKMGINFFERFYNNPEFRKGFMEEFKKLQKSTSFVNRLIEGVKEKII